MKCVLKIIIVASAFILCLYAKSKPKKFTFIHEHAYISYQNPEIIEVSTRFFKISREQGALNMSYVVKKRIDDISLRIETYRFSNGDFRKTAAGDFGVDLCPYLATDKEGLGLRRILKGCPDSNLTSCPVKPGTYLVCNISPRGDEYPALVPGRWTLKLPVIVEGNVVAILEWILQVHEEIP